MHSDYFKRRLWLLYLIQVGRASLRPCSRPTADTCTAPGPSRRWCSTSGSWWGPATAPYLATRFSPRPLSQTDVPLLSPPAPPPQEAPWSYCSLRNKGRLSPFKLHTCDNDWCARLSWWRINNRQSFAFLCSRKWFHLSALGLFGLFFFPTSSPCVM